MAYGPQESPQQAPKRRPFSWIDSAGSAQEKPAPPRPRPFSWIDSAGARYDASHQQAATAVAEAPEPERPGLLGRATSWVGSRIHDIFAARPEQLPDRAAVERRLAEAEGQPVGPPRPIPTPSAATARAAPTPLIPAKPEGRRIPRREDLIAQQMKRIANVPEYREQMGPAMRDRMIEVAREMSPPGAMEAREALVEKMAAPVLGSLERSGAQAFGSSTARAAGRLAEIFGRPLPEEPPPGYRSSVGREMWEQRRKQQRTTFGPAMRTLAGKARGVARDIESMTQEAGKLRTERTAATLTSMGLDPRHAPMVTQLGDMLSSGLVTSTGILAGGPALATPMMFLMGLGEIDQEAEQKGVKPEDRNALVELAGAYAYAQLERLGELPASPAVRRLAGRWARLLPRGLEDAVLRGTPVRRIITEFGLTEASEEAAQELTKMAIIAGAPGRQYTPDEVVKRVAMSAAGGLVGSLPMGLSTGIATKIRQHQFSALTSEERAALADLMGHEPNDEELDQLETALSDMRREHAAGLQAPTPEQEEAAAGAAEAGTGSAIELGATGTSEPTAAAVVSPTTPTIRRQPTDELDALSEELQPPPTLGPQRPGIEAEIPAPPEPTEAPVRRLGPEPPQEVAEGAEAPPAPEAPPQRPESEEALDRIARRMAEAAGITQAGKPRPTKDHPIIQRMADELDMDVQDVVDELQDPRSGFAESVYDEYIRLGGEPTDRDAPAEALQAALGIARPESAAEEPAHPIVADIDKRLEQLPKNSTLYQGLMGIREAVQRGEDPEDYRNSLKRYGVTLPERPRPQLVPEEPAAPAQVEAAKPPERPMPKVEHGRGYRGPDEALRMIGELDVPANAKTRAAASLANNWDLGGQSAFLDIVRRVPEVGRALEAAGLKEAFIRAADGYPGPQAVPNEAQAAETPAAPPDEGPFDTREDAQDFIDSEVSGPAVIEQGPEGFMVRFAPEKEAPEEPAPSPPPAERPAVAPEPARARPSMERYRQTFGAQGREEEPLKAGETVIVRDGALDILRAKFGQDYSAEDLGETFRPGKQITLGVDEEDGTVAIAGPFGDVIEAPTEIFRRPGDIEAEAAGQATLFEEPPLELGQEPIQRIPGFPEEPTAAAVTEAAVPALEAGTVVRITAGLQEGTTGQIVTGEEKNGMVLVRVPAQSVDASAAPDATYNRWYDIDKLKPTEGPKRPIGPTPARPEAIAPQPAPPRTLGAPTQEETGGRATEGGPEAAGARAPRAPAVEGARPGGPEGEGPGTLPGTEQGGRAGGPPRQEGRAGEEDLRGNRPEVEGEAPELGGVGAPERGGAGGEVRAGSDELAPETPTEQVRQRKGQDYRISEGEIDDLGGPKARARQNLEAIRIVKLLQEERRPATAEEQAQLVQYVGWGGLADMFPTPIPYWKRYGRGPTHEWKSEWEDLGKQLKDLLTDEEYETAQRSTQYAHYTTPEVINAIYGGLEQLGVTGPVRVVEPGAGIGHFLGLSPLQKARWTAIEMDHVTGAILGALYPSADVQVRPYQNVVIPDGTFDVAVGNPPFGDIPITDRAYGRKKWNIHDYFFIKTLDKMRDGGVLAFVTSTGTMDKLGFEARHAIADRADFLGAVRLPGGAFQKTAGTEVTTDILFFQRRERGAPINHRADWLDTGEIRVGEDAFPINQYYLAHPEQMLGEPVSDKIHPDRLGLASRAGEELADLLNSAIQKALPEGIYTKPGKIEDVGPTKTTLGEIPPDAKAGQYLLRGGQIVQVTNANTLEPIGLKASSTAGRRVAHLVGLGEAREAVVKLSREHASDAELQKAQAELTKTYDAFVKRYGPINKVKKTTRKDGVEVVRRPNLDRYNDPVMGPRVMALENYDEEKNRATKAAIFTKRLHGPPTESGTIDTAWKAVVASLVLHARINMPFIMEVYGKSEREIVDELGDQIFVDPATGLYETRERYLSGNVREKLALAEDAASRDGRFQKNVEALQAAQPEDVSIEQMKKMGAASIGVTWVDPGTYRDFMWEIGMSGADISYRSVDGKYSVRRGSVRNHAIYSEWGTARVDAIDLLRDMLNSRPTEIYDEIKTPEGKKKVKNVADTQAAEQKKQAIQRRFQAWLLDDDERRALKANARYNQLMNHTVLVDSDGSHLRGHMPGLAQTLRGHPLELRDHQIDGLWRYLSNGNTLIAWETGAGKTIAMVTMAMEAKRMGLVRKPMFAVENSTLLQFGREFLQIYPDAKILVADEYQFHTNRRREFLARVASDDWDAVILTHSSFKLIPPTPELMKSHLRQMIVEFREAYEAAKGEADQFSVKRLEKAIEKYENKLKDQIDIERDPKSVYFEDLGIDLLFVDEAHNFKNLDLPTAGSFGALTGSDKAMDLYLKTRHLERINPGRGLVFATATPISNKISEMYVMQRYLMEDRLRADGYGSFDAWGNNFVAQWSEPEFTAIGTLEERYRPRAYKNTYAMAQSFRTVADVKLAEDLDLDTPPLIGGEPEMVVIPGNERLRSFMKQLQWRWEHRPKGKPEKGADGVFPVMNDGRYGSIDARLVTSRHAAARGHDSGRPWSPGKAEYAAKRIYEIWKRHEDVRGAQLVFSNLGVPSDLRQADADAIREQLLAESPDLPEEEIQRIIEEEEGDVGYDIYNDVRSRLLEMGVPAKEIAFIQEAGSNKKKRQAIIDRVNQGSIRMLFGSTPTMGQGMNAQERLVALHHLDVPYKPSQLDQRRGRLIRQGNVLWEERKIEGVHELRYVLKGSYDQRAWQIIENKAGFIEDGMTAKADTGMVEETGGPTISAKDAYAIIKAEASDNPYAMDHAVARGKVRSLENERDEHSQKSFHYAQQIRNMETRLEQARDERYKAQRDVRDLIDTSGDSFEMTIRGRRYTDRAEAGKALIKEYDALEGRDEKFYHVGTFAGLRLEIRQWKWHARTPHWARLTGAQSYESTPNVRGGDPRGVVQSIERIPGVIREIPGRREEEIGRLQAEIEQMRVLKAEPFPKADELAQARETFKDLDQKIQAWGKEKAAGEGEAASEGGEEELRHSFGSAIRSLISGNREEQEREREAAGQPPLGPTGPETPGTGEFDDIVAALRGNRGAPTPRIEDQIKRAADRVYHNFTQSFQYLDSRNGATEAKLIDIARDLRNVWEYSQARAVQDLHGVIKDLGKPGPGTDLELFEHTLILRDIQRMLELGEDLEDVAQATLLEDLGIESPEQVARMLAGLEIRVADKPNVQDALAQRDRLNRQLKQELVQKGFLPAGVLKDDRYYHRQVLKYMRASVEKGGFSGIDTRGSDARVKRKSFQRERGERGAAFNTAYHEAEYEWVSHAYAIIRQKELLEEMQRTADIRETLKRQVKARNRRKVAKLVEATTDYHQYVAEQTKKNGERPASQQVVIQDPWAYFAHRWRWQIAAANEELAKTFEEEADAFVDEPDWVKDAISKALDAHTEGVPNPDPRWYRLLSHLSDEELPGADRARQIFKAVNDMDSGTKDFLEQHGETYTPWRVNTRAGLEAMLSLAPDGYTTWQPERGKHFFLAATLEERTLDQILAGEKTLTEEDVRRQLVMGGPRETWIVPEGLARQLDNWTRPQPADFKAIIERTQTMWKQYILLSPWRMARYNLNNMSGDLDIAFAGAPGIIRYTKGALADLLAYYRGTASPEQRAEIEEGLRRGVLNSGWAGFEVPDVNEHHLLKHLTSNDPRLIEKAFGLGKKFYRWSSDITTLRENLLRLAAWRHYRAIFEANPQAKVYAASRRDEVDALGDDWERKAAKVSRELIGDYGNISVAGQLIRRSAIPFWSWVEINAPRYYRLFKNLPVDESTGEVSGRAQLAKVLGKRVVWGGTKLAFRTQAYYFLALALGHLLWPEDKDLTPEEQEAERRAFAGSRRDLHIPLYRDSGGELVSVRIEGSAADALEWVGLNDWPEDIRDVLSGRYSLADKLAEAPKSAIDKLVQGIRPEIKTGLEVITKRALYPSIFAEDGANFALGGRRQIRDPLMHAFEPVPPLDLIVGKIEDALKGVDRPSRTQNVGEFLRDFVTYQTDPQESAYWEARTLAGNFRRHVLGEEAGGSGAPTDKSNALYYYKRSLALGNEEAAGRWIREYARLGGTVRGMEQSMRMSHPLYGLSTAAGPEDTPSELQRFIDSLSPGDRAMVNLGIKWYEDTYLAPDPALAGENGG